MATKPTLTAERLRDRLDYDPETGVFRWRALSGRYSRVTIGSVAGSVDKDEGYRRIWIEGRLHRAHRLAWLYVHGVWPSDRLDHRNEVRDDNRISNLREATQSENRQNLSRPDRDGNSGYLGVTERKGRWLAQIGLNGKRHYLGSFDDPQEASRAYLAAKQRLHPFANFD